MEHYSVDIVLIIVGHGPPISQSAMHYSNAANRSMNRSLRTCFSRIA